MTFSRPRLAVVLSALLAVSFAATNAARAQSRRFQSGTRFAPIVNPAHEKLKTQADQEYQKGNYARAVKLTNSVIAENPRDHVAYYLRGSARAEIARLNRDAKEMRGAIADARQAISLDSARSPMYYLPYLYGMTNLARIENRKEHAEVAVKIAGQVLALSSLKAEDRANLYYQRGNSYLVLKKFDEAVNDFQAAIKENSQHLGAYLATADAYAQAGKPDKAKEQYDATVKAFSDNPLVYNNRGMFLQHQGKLNEAIEDYTKALELNGNYFYAATNRAVCLHQQGQLQAAENDFTLSLKINPRQPAVHALRAALRMAQGRVDEAVADSRAAVQLDPKNPSTRADLGFSLFFAGKYGEASMAFEQSAKLDKTQHHLAPWRFLSLELSGNKGKALETFAAMLKKKPEQRDWVEVLVAYLAGWIDDAKLLQSTNQTDESAKSAQLCEAHYFIGLRQQLAKNAEAAREHFEKAVATKQRQLSAFQGAQLALKKPKVAGAGAGPKRIR